MPIPLRRTDCLGDVTAAVIYGKRIKEASEALGGIFKSAKIEKIPFANFVYVIAAAIQGQAGNLDPKLVREIASIAAMKISPMGEVTPADVSMRAQEIITEITKRHPELPPPTAEQIQRISTDPQFMGLLKQKLELQGLAGQYITDVQTKGIWPQGQGQA